MRALIIISVVTATNNNNITVITKMKIILVKIIVVIVIIKAFPQVLILKKTYAITEFTSTKFAKSINPSSNVVLAPFFIRHSLNFLTRK